MKLLITGGSGFLGRRVAAHFEKLGWQVLAPSHGELEITNGAALRAWFRENRPDAVIHTAAVSDTGLCQQKPEWSEAINVTGTLNLASCCREVGAKLVTCSSDQIYFSSPVPGPHREEDPVAPVNVYGLQKLRGEQGCLKILPETVCLRLSWMYARDSAPGERAHFLTNLKAGLADETKPLTWPIHDRRGITDAAEVVANLPKALELPGGVWNFGSANHQSTYDTVRSILEAAGRQDALARLMPNTDAFAQNPRDISMDLTKLTAAGIAFSTTAEALLRAIAK